MRSPTDFRGNRRKRRSRDDESESSRVGGKKERTEPSLPKKGSDKNTKRLGSLRKGGKAQGMLSLIPQKKEEYSPVTAEKVSRERGRETHNNNGEETARGRLEAEAQQGTGIEC